MLESEELDAVAICGPPQLHTEAGIASLEAGLHVFVEKPPSVNFVESRRFLKAARNRLAQSPGFGGVRMVSVNSLTALM